MASVILTSTVVAFVCKPPFHYLHTWTEVLFLAAVYLLLAASVHLSTVLVVLRTPVWAKRPFRWPTMLGTATKAWIAVSWLPLLALLTAEKSPWVALILPLAAVWAVVFFSLQSARRSVHTAGHATSVQKSGLLFSTAEEAPILRTLWPVLCTAVAVESGFTLLVVHHAWWAGVMLAGAASYVAVRILWARFVAVSFRRGGVAGASGGNTVIVWTLLVLALAPFLAGIGMALRDLVGIQVAHAEGARSPKLLSLSQRGGLQYSGVILLSPPKPHDRIVVPVQTTSAFSLSKPHVIPFDGAYWYFKEPDTRPGRDAHIAHGDPVTHQIHSTDIQPLIMEAHQELARPLDVSCCRALRLDLVNGDAIPGQIKVEILFSGAGRATTRTTLGEKILVSSTVNPMPLSRAPVHESLTFEIPRRIRNSPVDEITVRLKPERMRALGAPRVSIQDFALQP